MKILLIGGNGTIGKRLTERLQNDHELIVAGKSSGDLKFNMESSSSIRELFEQTGKLDAIVAVAGEAKCERFENLSEEDYMSGIKSKLMGQVNLVRIGRDYLNPGGSITLTSGILADEPEFMTTIPAMIDGAINSFVKAVSLESGTIRVNVVCSDVVEDSFEKYKDYFPGHSPVPMIKVADAYINCITGTKRGEIIRIKSS
jgi:NAD(P)-dependent dehydrogenase (short-subunit alcohol dehydrogenase family)